MLCVKSCVEYVSGGYKLDYYPTYYVYCLLETRLNNDKNAYSNLSVHLTLTVTALDFMALHLNAARMVAYL